MTKMTKEELMKRLEELETENETLKSRTGQTVKNRIMELIESGMNTIEELAETCAISSKNVSSNLTRIRAELAESHRTIVTQRFGNQTKLAVVELKDLNWL